MILATVLCGQCRSEGRRDAGKLGHVVKRPDTGGTVYWWGNRASAKSQRDTGPGIAALVGTRLLDPSRPDWTPPRAVPTHCRRHGRGSVSADEITAARGTVFATFTAKR